MSPFTYRTTEELFWAKVDKSGDCWEWTGARHESGYGSFKADGKVVRAHRFAYSISNGPIPDGMQIDHTCHTVCCVRPDHLRVATQKENQENASGPYGNSKSGVRGVYWNKQCRKWQGIVRHNSKGYHAGLFVERQQAEDAVIALRNQLFTHNDRDRQQQQAS